jgi:hypothetical protein
VSESSPAAPPRRTLGQLQKGDRLFPCALRVGADDVRAYLDATGESPERWEQHVPPLALIALGLAGLMERVEVVSGVVHTGQEHTFTRAVRHDEPLEVVFSVATRSERRGALITAFESEWRAGGELIGTARTTVLLAAPGVDGESAS